MDVLIRAAVILVFGIIAVNTLASGAEASCKQAEAARAIPSICLGFIAGSLTLSLEQKEIKGGEAGRKQTP